jgi:excisionase family DNA binding protein
MSDTEVLTTKEAAALLRLTQDTIRRQAAAGQIPAHRLGTRGWRFYREELHQYLRGEWQSSNVSPAARTGYGSSLAARIFSEAREQLIEKRRRSSSKPFAIVTGGRSS